VEHVLGSVRFWRKKTPLLKAGAFSNCKPRSELRASVPALGRRPAFSAGSEPLAYNRFMERKVFWMVFMALGLVADFLLPLWWGIAATIPIVFIAWWVAYRSDWF
jgi:hypothetical protein